MAELIEATPSSIGVAEVVARLTTSITTLKDLWDHQRDAPEDLRWLIKDIQIFRNVFHDIEADMAQESIVSSLVNSRPALQCFKLCNEAAKDLDILIENLKQDLNSESRLEFAYAAMERNKVNNYQLRLLNVLQILSLSQQCYIRALTQIQPELVAKRVAMYMVESQSTVDSTLDLAASEKKQIRGANSALIKSRKAFDYQKNTYRWRFQAPSWITTKALEIAGLRAPDGWKLALHVYNTVSLWSKVVDFAGIGDIEGLQKLFSSGEASPFDRIEGNGYTLLHYAGGENREEVYKFLLDQGADPLVGGVFRSPLTPLEHLVWSGSMAWGQPLLPSLRCLLPRSEDPIYETPEEAINGILSSFHGTSEEFVFLQQECCPTYYQMSQSTRVAVTTGAACGVWDAFHMPDLIKTMLGKESLSVENLQSQCFTDMGEVTLVHSIARKCGGILASVCASRQRPSTKSPSGTGHCDIIDKRANAQMKLYKAWTAMFCEFIATGVDLHNVVDRHSLLTSFIDGYIKACSLKRVTFCQNIAIQIWMADLQAVGVDLEDFGRAEALLFDSGCVLKDYISYSFGDVYRLNKFIYGPSPQDWHLMLEVQEQEVVKRRRCF
ncbi:hypothetical protein B0O99DRAFT_702385 [Bisporella sp. PMI_857]|nr:hypothetical protein B0O99DRAFT_702385 [Bisporella sp. PMI_857]